MSRWTPADFAPGTTHARWTVIRRATPEQRDGDMRARVVCKCACGWEQIVWVGDLQRKRSLGCRFAACRHRYASAQRLRRVLPQPVVEQLLSLAAEREQPVHRILGEALAELRGGSVEA